MSFIKRSLDVIQNFTDPGAFTGFLPHERPLHSGYLGKLGKNGLVKRWQQRFFVLYKDRLDYWLDEKEFKERRKKKGCIELSNCSLATAEQHTKRFSSFGIFHITRGDYFLEAPTQCSLMAWLELIEGVLGVKDKGVSMADFDLTETIGKGRKYDSDDAQNCGSDRGAARIIHVAKSCDCVTVTVARS